MEKVNQDIIAKKYMRTEERQIFITLFIILFTNAALGILSFPLLVALVSWQRYIVIATIAFFFGLIIDYLFTHFEHLDNKHHVLFGLLIFIIALINMAAFTTIANQFMNNTHLGQLINPILMAFVYAFAFLIPFLLGRLR